MKTIHSAYPGVRFERIESFEVDGVSQVAAFCQAMREAGEARVCWRDAKERALHDGVWLRAGACRTRHGSFVDPVDLSVYGGQYYEVVDAGRQSCLQVGFGEAPEGALATADATSLADALDALFCPGASDEQAEADAAPLPSDARLLQPSSAFEFHGKLTRGWRVALYEGAAEDGTEEEPARLVVFE